MRSIQHWFPRTSHYGDSEIPCDHRASGEAAVSFAGYFKSPILLQHPHYIAIGVSITIITPTVKLGITLAEILHWTGGGKHAETLKSPSGGFRPPTVSYSYHTLDPFQAGLYNPLKTSNHTKISTKSQNTIHRFKNLRPYMWPSVLKASRHCYAKTWSSVWWFHLPHTSSWWSLGTVAAPF